MLKTLDSLLNRVTMYRLMLYYLIGLLVIGLWEAQLGRLGFSALALIISSCILVAACYLSNRVFASLFRAPINTESSIITGLILALIITPKMSLAGMVFILSVSVVAMASKYLLAIRKVHLFNPAALGVLVVGYISIESASWWVATQVMLPFVIIGGILLARKIQRFEMIFWFSVSALLATALFAHLSGHFSRDYLGSTLTSSALFFMAFVMLTEPLTSPATIGGQRAYALLAGVLFSPQVHLGGIYSTPQLDLIIVNVFAYLIGPKLKLLPQLVSKRQLSPDVDEFVFKTDRQFNFKPGQYMEWTLPHQHTDSRGDRRCFTIASAPTEPELHLAVKYYPDGSSYKNRLLQLKPGQPVKLSAGQLGGDFTLPKETSQKIVFIAGGIGITPYRSMVKYLLDNHEKRSVVLLYAANRSVDLVYRDVFERARAELGIKTTYVLSQTNSNIENEHYVTGPITPKLISQQISDYQERLFYISGPHAMVEAVRSSLKQAGVRPNKIKVDFFPGYA